MKIKNLLLFLLAIPGVCISSSTLTDSSNQYTYFEKFTPSQISTLSLRHYFNSTRSPFNTTLKSDQKSKTVIFNQALTEFIKEMYNNKYYSFFLSQNGTHVIEFLELGNELNLDEESLCTCLRLLHNKIKSCEQVDDTVINQILKPLPYLLEKYFSEEEVKTSPLEFLKKNIEKTLLFKFSQRFSEFQANPNVFISDVSDEISQIAKEEFDYLEKNNVQKEYKDRLRQTVIRFLESTLGKIMWDITAYEGIWESVISISNGLLVLGTRGILDHMDDLDDLQWSLTLRFCYFLDIAGSYLPISFFEEVESDLNSKVAFFLEAQELDEGIKSKKEVLIEALSKAKSKAIAFEKNGHFTDQII